MAHDTHDLRAKKGLVLIAGGISLAPVMSILNTLAERSDRRPVYVFYGDPRYKSVFSTEGRTICRALIYYFFRLFRF